MFEVTRTGLRRLGPLGEVVRQSFRLRDGSGTPSPVYPNPLFGTLSSSSPRLTESETETS